MVRAVQKVAIIETGYDNPSRIPGLTVSKLWSTKCVPVLLKHTIRML